MCIQVVNAQNKATGIKGKVADKAGKPLAFASVVIDTLKAGVSCDEQGNYRIENIPAGTYIIVASLTGYHKQIYTVTLQAGKEVIRNFVLQPDESILKEVKVEAQNEAKKIEETGFNVNVIETRQFENRALTINQILSQTTGVRIRETGGVGADFEFSLNGLSGNQVRFFIDGVPLENYGSAFSLNNIPSNLIERIEVYKGAVPVELGSDALGGAINIVTKKKNKNYLDASYSYGSYNTHLANLSGQYRSSVSGFTVRPQVYYNYSKNNYKMYNLRTLDTTRSYYVGNFERYHDMYRSYLAGGEAGFTQVKWADEIMLGISYGKIHNNIQTGYAGSRNSDDSFNLDPFSKAFSEEENLNFSLKYRNTRLLDNKLNVNLSLSGNFIDQKHIDTASYSYNWQNQIIETHPNGSEADASNKYTFHYEQKYVLLNSGATYRFNNQHQVSANFIYDFLSRQGRNTYYPSGTARADPFIDPNHLSKSVLGIAYQNAAWKERLQTTAFVKLYHIDILTRQSIQYLWGGDFVTEDIQTKQQQLGYGLASRLKFGNVMGKVSYEYALRQPEQIEIFGDGFLLLANPNIKPETSHNLNAGAAYKFRFSGKDALNVSADGFVRKVENLIRLAPGGGRYNQYINLFKIFIKGIEGEIRYNHKWGNGKTFTAGANLTYQAVLNNEKYIQGTARPNYVYRDKLYNTPFLFGNWDLGYTFNLTTAFKLSAFYSGNYVEEFFLNYPSVATTGTKNIIPTQVLNHAGTTLSTNNGRYNLTLECNNLANARAYDNFAIQKPGRMFTIKFRVFLI